MQAKQMNVTQLEALSVWTMCDASVLPPSSPGKRLLVVKRRQRREGKEGTSAQ